MADFPWYQKGLSFQCTGCGKCCTGFPGYVWVESPEIKAIASFLEITIEELAEKYLRQAYGRISLREDPVSFDCIFLKEKKFCSIYPVRPKQCKTFPFWPKNLVSEETWQETAQICEGIQEDSPVVPFETIQECADSHDVF